MSAIVETKNLTKYYGKARGIIDVSLSIEEGEIFGFIGPNGASKSTTIRTLLALIRPTGGSATIFGKDCVRFAPEIAQNVGYLPSEVFYYDGMRVKELLEYSASFYRRDCSRRIAELAEQTGSALVTAVLPFRAFKASDKRYQNYYDRNREGPFCAAYIEPKLALLRQRFAGLRREVGHVD